MLLVRADRCFRGYAKLFLKAFFERHFGFGCPLVPQALKDRMCTVPRVSTPLDSPGPVVHVSSDVQTVVPTVQPTADNVIARDAVPVWIAICGPSVERLHHLPHQYLVGRTEANAACKMPVEASPDRFVSVIHRRFLFVDPRSRADDQLELYQPINPVKSLQPETVTVPFLPLLIRIELLRDTAEDHLVQIDHLLLEWR